MEISLKRSPSLSVPTSLPSSSFDPTNSHSSSEVIKAFVRIRPPISSEIGSDLCVHCSLNNKEISLSSEKYEIKCSYNFIFSELSTQEEVFLHVKPLLDDVLVGYNGCIFAYGQTSAGKVIYSSFF